MYQLSDKAIEGNPVHALGQLFHPEHLKCNKCQEVITGTVFEHNSATYCEVDYAEYIAPRCKGCKNPITGETVCALGGQFHTSCFNCSTCARDFPDNNFYVLEGNPYCKIHYHEKNGSLCGGCQNPIEGECAEIAELDKKFHPACWTCHQCHKPLSDTYYSYDGVQLCERDMLLMFEEQLKQDLDFKAKANKRSTRIIEIN